jgi:hypothetical protein
MNGHLSHDDKKIPSTRSATLYLGTKIQGTVSLIPMEEKKLK